MGRRSLKRVDPSLDLSRHLQKTADLPRPWDAQRLFGRRAPLEIEIGTGKGLFLLRAAGRFPEHDFLGIEMAGKYARFAAARLAKADVPNALVAHGDATPVVGELLPAESVEAVHVYFPDPWWKKRHHKRRIMNDPFLRHVERVLAPGGRLHFWTDVEEYFSRSLARIAAVTSLAGPFPAEQPPAGQRPAEDALDYRTHFERRMRLAGSPIFRSEFVRQGP